MNSNNNDSIKIFKDIDTSSNYLLALNIRSSINPKHFYLDLNDTEKFKSLMNNWTFELTDVIGRCGYDYSISYSDNINRELALICFSCNSLILNSSEFYHVDEAYFLTLLKQEFKPIHILKKVFSTTEEGRLYWANAKNDSNLLIKPSTIPKWLNYEGKFELIVDINTSETQDSIIEKHTKSSLEKILHEYQLKIDYDFNIYYRTNSTFTFHLYANEELFQNLDYKRKSNFEKFKKFELDLFYK